MAELATSGFAVKLPGDLGASAIDPAIPGSSFPSQSREVRDSSGAGALPQADADFDFNLIEPASVSRRVVHGEPVPDFAPGLGAVPVRQGLAAMRIQVVHHQVDALGKPACLGIGQNVSEGNFYN
jgi:hypothetical protein